MKTTKTIRATLMFAFLFITACGNKGDLFLTESNDAKSAPQVTENANKSTKTIDVKNK